MRHQTICRRCNASYDDQPHGLGTDPDGTKHDGGCSSCCSCAGPMFVLKPGAVLDTGPIACSRADLYTDEFAGQLVGQLAVEDHSRGLDEAARIYRLRKARDVLLSASPEDIVGAFGRKGRFVAHEHPGGCRILDGNDYDVDQGPDGHTQESGTIIDGFTYAHAVLGAAVLNWMVKP